MRADLVGQAVLRSNRLRVQFGIAAGQPQRVALGQIVSRERREEMRAGTLLSQKLEIRRVDEAERQVTRDGNAPTLEQILRFDGRRFWKGHAPAFSPLRILHLAQHRLRQGLGHARDRSDSIRHLGGGHQPQMARRNGRLLRRLAHHQPQPVHASRHAGAQHFAMPLAGHAIGEHAGHAQSGSVIRQAERQRAEGLGHGRGVDHQQNRQVEALGEICRAANTVVEAHGRLDQDDIVAACRARQTALDIGLAAHRQIEVVYRLTAGQRQPGRVEKIRSALEYLHPLATRMQQMRERGGDGGFALPGRGRSHQQHRAGRRAGAGVFGLHGNDQALLLAGMGARPEFTSPHCARWRSA